MEDLQFIYKLALIFGYAFFGCYWFMPYMKSHLKKYGHEVQDKYKKGNKKFVTMGGIAIMVGILVSLSLSQIILSTLDLGKLFIFYFIILIYAFYGLLDDMFKYDKRYDKILTVLVLSFPIASLLTDTTLDFLNIHIHLGWFFAFVIAPVYIMVVANLINLHAGFNGQVTGLSWILLLFIGIKSYTQDGLTNLIYIIPVFAALTAFLKYNLYPAQAHDGNIGAFLLGAAIGALLLTLNLEFFGIFILIPHIINFLMDTWTIIIRKKKDIKFGTLRADGTIAAPPSMKYKSIKFWLCSNFRLTEQQAVYIQWGITLVFCVIGLMLF